MADLGIFAAAAVLRFQRSETIQRDVLSKREKEFWSLRPFLSTALHRSRFPGFGSCRGKLVKVSLDESTADESTANESTAVK